MAAAERSAVGGFGAAGAVESAVEEAGVDEAADGSLLPAETPLACTDEESLETPAEAPSCGPFEHAQS